YTLGIDSSRAMIEQVKAQRAANLEFRSQEIEKFNEPGWDLIFSHAALHWISDHRALFKTFSQLLNPAGQIAIQIPANENYPTQQISKVLAQEAPFYEALEGYVQSYGNLDIAEYAELLAELGFSEQHVRMQVYSHRLPSREAVVQWVLGTHLSDYKRRLPSALFEKFLDAYRERLFAALPDTKPFFYPFKRILI